MLVKSDIPQLLLAGMRTEFMKSFENAEKQYVNIATEIASTKSSETYPWLGSVPKMREWTDERVPKGLLEHDFTIPNRDFEASIAVDKNAIEDEQYGQIEIRTRELSTEAVRFFDELVFTLIPEGINTTGTGSLFEGRDVSCYDSKAFFATNHSEGTSGTHSNRGSTAISLSALQAAITAMRKFKNDQGKPSGIRPNVLVVPPDLEWSTKKLINSPTDPSEGTATSFDAVNSLYKNLTVVVNDYLTDTNNWYLFDTRRVVKPIILQMRKAPAFSNLVNNTESEFMRKKLYFGVDWRGAAAFGDWRTGYASIVS